MTVRELRMQLAKYPADLEVKLNDYEYGFCNFRVVQTNHPTKPWVVLEGQKS